jgi:hypothetical protein
MSIKHAIWKKRTEYRFSTDSCFDLDNPGSADPRELQYGIVEAYRQQALAAIGTKDVLKGDWDVLNRTITPSSTTATDVAGQADAGTPVTLAIGRYGDPIVITGENQLRSLDDDHGEIPVRIAFVHPRWQRFRNQVLNFSDAHHGKVYQKIHHPDLIRVPYGHGDERLELMKPCMPIRSGTVLDIGANWGYWSHSLTRLGLACTAVDHNPKNALFVKQLRRAMNGSFEFVASSIFELPGPLTYDLILGLNIFHHFIRDQATFEKFCRLLESFDASYMFFEPHRPHELENGPVFKNMSEDEFVAFILERSCFNTSRLLGTTLNDRQLYFLTR